MNAIAAFLIASAGTFALRYASVRSFSSRTLDHRVAAVLRHAALGIMASLVVTALPSTGDVPATEPAAIVGVGAGVLAARRLGNVSVVIGVAVAAYAIVRGIGPS